MPHHSNLRSFVAIVAWCATAAASVGQTAAPSIEQRLSDPVYLAWVSEPSVAECVSCHAGLNVAALIGGTGGKLTPFSRQQEMDAWITKDKHTIARRRVEPFDSSQQEQQLIALLDSLDKKSARAKADLAAAGVRLGETSLDETVLDQWVGQGNLLSRRICDKLWGEGTVMTADGYALFRDQCLTCHGGYEKGMTGFDLPSPSAETGDALSKSLIGIACQSCHQAGENMEWEELHTVPTQWRLLTPGEKQAHGMRDLVNTAAQAKLCFDCHIGNRDKNMFVTHQMYAAGHPPLPSIEVERFCDEMPRHWQTPSELYENAKNEPSRDQYFEINYPGVTTTTTLPNELRWDTRQMLIGGLVARRQVMQLYVQSAGEEHWGDYALYDCSACHHELQSPSARQQRYDALDYGTPGRPRPHEWSYAILASVMQQGGPTIQKTYQAELELRYDFDSRPFGDPENVVRDANALIEQFDVLIETISQRPIDARIARQMLTVLSSTPSAMTISYDSARQLAWAIATIADEMKSRGDLLPTAMMTLVAQMGDPEVTGLDLSIPSSRQSYIYPEGLKKDLAQRSAYDPVKFAGWLRRFNMSLKQD